MAQTIYKDDAITPATPDTGYMSLYPKAGTFYQLDEFGTETPLGGSAKLSAITAADADNTIDNTQWQQEWKWSLSTNFSTAFHITDVNEVSTGTGSTLVRFSTHQDSRASPLSVSTGNGASLGVGADGSINMSAGIQAVWGVTPGDGGNVGITGGTISGSFTADAGYTLIQGGYQNPTSASAGLLWLHGGQGTVSGSNGGATQLTAGGGGDNGNGGALSIASGGGGAGTGGNGGNISISAGAGTTINHSGGQIFVTAGDSTGAAFGANINLIAGNNIFPGTGNGGEITLEGGTASAIGSFGGAALLRGGGNLAFGDGGQVSVLGGGGVNGGLAVIQAGTGTTGNGGLTQVIGGAAAGSGTGGGVQITGGGSLSGNAGGVTIAGGTPATSGNGGAVSVTGSNGVGVATGGSLTLGAGTGAGGGQDGVINFTFGGSDNSRFNKRYWTQGSSGSFSTFGDAVTRQYVLRNQTTNAVTTELYLDGTVASERLQLSDDTTWHFEIKVVARRTDANDESFAWKSEGAIDRNVLAATTALVSATNDQIIADDSGGTWTVTVTADTTFGSLKIEVTGEAAKTIDWVAFVRTVEVTG